MTNQEIRKLLLSDTYDFLRDNPHLGNRIMLLTLGGSHAYGTAHAGSDLDIRGIAAEKPEELIGLEEFEQVLDKNTDTTIYAFNKMFKLLYACNPNTIEILGTEPEDRFYVSKEGQMLIDNAHLFLSKQAQYTFAGYAKDQLIRLKSILARNSGDAEVQRHIVETMDNRIRVFNDRFTPVSREQINLFIDKSDKSTVDEEIFMDISLNRYPLKDFNAILEDLNRMIRAYASVNSRNRKVDDKHLNKHASHLIRLYLMAIDILEKEIIQTKRIQEHDLLVSIINGEYQKPDGSYRDEFFQMLNEYEKRFKYAVENTSLPEVPDKKKVQELKMEINRSILSK